jgi:hypothetical protein
LAATFETRLYHSGDEEEIIQLLRSCFSSWNNLEKPLDYWKWKYLDAPLGSIIRLAETNGKIVGVGHGVLLNVKIGSNMILSQMSGDVTTHIDFRGKGIYTMLDLFNDKTREEKKVMFNYSTSRNPIILNLKRKIERVIFPHPISYLVRINDIKLHLKNRPMKNSSLLQFGYKVMELFNKREHISSIQSSDFKIEGISSFDTNINAFWDKVKNYYTFILEKNQKFLNWRYCDPQSGTYFIYEALFNTEVLGYITVKITKEDEYSEGFIMDLLTLPGRIDVANALLNRATDLIDNKDVNIIYYESVDNNPYQEVALKNGFINSQTGPNVLCVLGDENYKLIKDSSPNQVAFTYSDLF